MIKLGFWNDLFKSKGSDTKKYTIFKELGNHNSVFYSFGDNIYNSEIVRSCIRTLAEHSSKANCVSTDKSIQKILQCRPNRFMNGKDFIYKVRTILEIKNTSFVYISRDDKGKAIEFYPVPYLSYKAIESGDYLFIEFKFVNERKLVLPWDDLAVLRKDYYTSDISGSSNVALLSTLEAINIMNQGISNAVKSTANLRGIIQSKQGMLAPEDVKKMKDEFVSDYMNLSNEGGIAALDDTMTFTPVTMAPVIANFQQLKEFRENVYRYYGVNDSIIMSDFTEAQFEAFYESKIEPFLVALSLELTNKVFTERERGFGNTITFESNRMQFMSTSNKLAMYQLVDRGILCPNELRQIFNLAPVPEGESFIRRLDTAKVEDTDSINQTKERGEEDAKHAKSD